MWCGICSGIWSPASWLPVCFFELLLLIPPFVLSYALPFGVLTGVLLVLGRMSAEHEIRAIERRGPEFALGGAAHSDPGGARRDRGPGDHRTLKQPRTCPAP